MADEVKPCPNCSGTGVVGLELSDMCDNCGQEYGHHTARDSTCVRPMKGGGFRVKPGSHFHLDAAVSRPPPPKRRKPGPRHG